MVDMSIQMNLMGPPSEAQNKLEADILSLSGESIKSFWILKSQDLVDPTTTGSIKFNIKLSCKKRHNLQLGKWSILALNKDMGRSINMLAKVEDLFQG